MTSQSQANAGTLPGPIRLQAWIDEHRHLLKPPVGNKVIWKDGDFIVMVVGGPNQRNDFHYNEGPELFYQLEGEMELVIMENGERRHIPIRAGEMFLLPPKVPHSPQRKPNSVGLVVERQRMAQEQDGLIWYCPQCNRKLYEEYFHLENIETQFGAIFQRFNGSEQKRRCQHCDTLHPQA
jgi:3-hydroxyanthranilate 3,4-dioxygenase